MCGDRREWVGGGWSGRVLVETTRIWHVWDKKERNPVQWKLSEPVRVTLANTPNNGGKRG